MALINENFLKLQGSYLFSEISKRVETFQKQNPTADIIRLGIGDVTRELPPAVIKGLHDGVDDMGDSSKFMGYGPYEGYDFLREKIARRDYNEKGIDIQADEIFVSDGAKSDTANIQELFSSDVKIGVTDPVYPVYIDTNVLAGRSGQWSGESWSNIQYFPCNAQNQFIPAIPDDDSGLGLIYLCFPNNPTGTTLSKDELKKWVDYARKNKAIILFDAAYEAYISEQHVPHSIYEIEGAKEVAIEFRSFSKNAGFTGTRCSFVVIPKQLMGYTSDGQEVSLNKLWFRRQSTKYNGVSYIIQKGAEAVYSDEGQAQVRALVDYYMKNAKIIREGLMSIGMTIFGGINAPYIWLKTPDQLSSWDFFDKLLEQTHIVGTPGVGFGPSGQGYFRLTAFGSTEATLKAMDRISKL